MDPRSFAKLLADRLEPILGQRLAIETANNAVVVASMDEDEDVHEPLVDVVRAILKTRRSHPGEYHAEHVTEAMFDQAVKAVESMDWFKPNSLVQNGPRGLQWPKKAKVYHATTGLRGILREGFKTRRQLGGVHALGGGPDSAISFTLSEKTALSIAIGLWTIRGIARHEIGLGDLIIQASQISPELLEQVKKNLELNMHAVTSDDVVRIDRGMRWFSTRSFGPTSAQAEELRPHVEEFQDESFGRYSGWVDAELYAKVTGDEERWKEYGQYRPNTVEAYKTLLHFGGWNGVGGRVLYNPLFMHTNLAALSKVADADLGIVRTTLRADWLCSGPDAAREIGLEPPEDVARSTLFQWAEGCEVELDRQRYGDERTTPKTRAEYHSTLPRGWDPPDPSDTIALMSSMAEVRVWNTKLINEVDLSSDLRDVINDVRDAWDRKGLIIDDPYWMPFHRDEVPFIEPNPSRRASKRRRSKRRTSRRR